MADNIGDNRSERKTKRCPECGKELDFDDLFCEYCGCDTTKVRHSAPVPNEQKPKRKPLWWIPVAAMVLAAAGVFVFLNVGKDSAVVGSLGSEPEVITVNNVSFNMIPVQGGTFTMGATPEQDNAEHDEYPSHEVTVSDYYIAETEVTQRLWIAVMGGNPSIYTGDDLPVEEVSWDDCQEFIGKLNDLTGRNFRLPTEAEWEYAARGGNKSHSFKYSGSDEISEVAWCKDHSTHAVARKKPNELGIYDMSGNVWEWCQDWFGDYGSEPQTNPDGPRNGTYRVLRGSSWDYGEKYCRVSFRYGAAPTERHNFSGLRLAMTP